VFARLRRKLLADLGVTAPIRASIRMEEIVS
jgi:hypothetical protein